MHTKDMLARELHKLGLTMMADAATAGYYHDYLSPLAMPEMQLVNDLAYAAQIAVETHHKVAILELRERVKAGDFDASAEESDEWAQSEEGQETFRRLVDGK